MNTISAFASTHFCYQNNETDGENFTVTFCITIFKKQCFLLLDFCLCVRVCVFLLFFVLFVCLFVCCCCCCFGGVVGGGVFCLFVLVFDREGTV